MANMDLVSDWDVAELDFRLFFGLDENFVGVEEVAWDDESIIFVEFSLLRIGLVHELFF